MTINFTLNGKKVSAEITPGLRLLDLLRESFRLTGTKEACGQGECGACTIIVDNQTAHACLMLAAQADGCDVLTIEGLALNGELDALQNAFLEAGAIQCGYCTPGMIMAAKGLLLQNPSPTLDEIKNAMAGNICRCTGYKKIQHAVELAAQKNTRGGASCLK